MQSVFVHNSSFFAQVEYSYSSEGKPPGPIFWIFWTVFTILMIAAWWKIFSKAGQPGLGRHYPDL
jgi:hypothetical protein